MRARWLLLVPALAGCGQSLLFLEYPPAPQDGVGTEVLLVETEGALQAYVAPVESRWIADPVLRDDQQTSLTALLYLGTPEDNGVAPGPLTAQAGAALPLRTEAGVFVASLQGRTLSPWAPLRSGAPRAALPYRLPGRSATALAGGASERHTCALYEGGELRCWGSNDRGQIGGEAARATSPPQAPVLRDVKQVSLGGSHTCALTNQGRVLCFGDNRRAQLGRGFGGLDRSNVPLEVLGLEDVQEIAAGESWTCALHASGAVSCWGFVTADFPSSPLPTTIPFERPLEHIANSPRVVCGVGGGALYCAGAATCQLIPGVADDQVRTTSVSVAPGQEISMVSMGYSHACALTNGGELYCWGCSGKGQVGAGMVGVISAPARVASDVRSMSLGGEASCALYADGAARCWGSNNYGQIGLGAVDGEVHRETALSLEEPRALGLLLNHSCALNGRGELYCWGDGEDGQIGVGAQSDVAQPTRLEPPLKGAE